MFVCFNTKLSEENMTSAESSSSPSPLPLLREADSKMLAKNPPNTLPTPSEAPPPPPTALMSEAFSRDCNE